MNNSHGCLNLAFVQAITILTFFLSIQVAIAQVDYRNYQSPIKSQGSRGTCTAFSVAAVLEVTPYMPADVSEQYLYAALKHSQPGVTYQEGDLFINYKKPLASYGVVSEAVMPYQGASLDWESDTNDFTKLIKGAQVGKVGLYQYSKNATYGIKEDNFIHMDSRTIHDVEQIKKLLDAGVLNIAVIYTNIHIPVWSQTKSTANQPFIPTISVDINGEQKRYIDIYKTYEGDLTRDIFTGKLPYYLINTKTKLEDGTTRNNYGAHAVNIVGYNDNGFIFKNSWGTDWGDNGYGYISFAAHKLMSREGLFFGNIDMLYPEKITELHENALINLKTSLFFDENTKPNFYLTLEQPIESYAIKEAQFIIYSQQNKELSRETLTFHDDEEKLLGFAPFKNTLMPPDLLFNKDHLHVNVVITGENDLVIKRYYRAITTGAGIYSSRDIEKSHTINFSDTEKVSFKELFVFENEQLGFEVNALDFHQALQNSKVDFTADKKLVTHNVFYKGKPFKYATYKFNYDDVPKLVEVELVFNNDEDAKTYFKKYYTQQKFEKYNASLNRPFQSTMYLNQETYPRQAQVWYYKNKIFMMARLKNSKWSN
jgi:hypothetical protein